jgi:Flp pilus assembly protein TadG
MVFMLHCANWTAAMLETLRSKIATRARPLLPVRVVRRFARHQDGAAAVEFAMIAVPFLALLFAILETALVFFAGQTLEAATADSARLIMTGQAQTTNYATGSADAGGYSKADFKNAVCSHIFGLFDCANGVFVNVKSYSSFASVNTASPITSGNLDTTQMGYSLGGPGDIVVVQLFYKWPIYVSLLGNDLANLNGGDRLLVATAVFRNEPYVTSSGGSP